MKRGKRKSESNRTYITIFEKGWFKLPHKAIADI
jgi:hypothetical protein